MKHKYNCSVPIAGFVDVVVEAESQSVARDLAIEAAADFIGGWNLKDTDRAFVGELNVFDQITTGSTLHALTLHAPVNEIEVERGEIDDLD